jgi:hypothetical protein
MMPRTARICICIRRTEHPYRGRGFSAPDTWTYNPLIDRRREDLQPILGEGQTRDSELQKGNLARRGKTENG